MYNYINKDLLYADYAKLEERMLAMYAARQRTKDNEMISTYPVGTILKHTSGKLIIKSTMNGEASGLVYGFDLTGTACSFYAASLTYMTPALLEDGVVEKLQSMIKSELKATTTPRTQAAPFASAYGKSDGSTADYYQLPKGATQLQDLISDRNMNAQLGEIFRAAYRFGMAAHSDQLRDAKKIKFYIEAEIKRLENVV